MNSLLERSKGPSLLLKVPALVVLIALWTVVPVCADKSEQALTPSERIKINQTKAEEAPSLRGRWTKSASELPSEETTLTDNLAQEILSNFRTDKELMGLPVAIKVSTLNGQVSLGGVVNSESEKELIESKIRRMSGVRSLESRLRIKQSEHDLIV